MRRAFPGCFAASTVEITRPPTSPSACPAAVSAPLSTSPCSATHSPSHALPRAPAHPHHRRHPASGYVQGINDLVTPFMAVFMSEHLEVSECGSGSGRAQG